MWKGLMITFWLVFEVMTIHGQELCQTELGYEYFIQGIMENTLPNTEIGHVVIEGNNSQIEIIQTEHKFYSFNNITRNVTLKKELDTDQGAEEIQPLYLNCRKLGRSGQDSGTLRIIVYVLVTDWNDNPPVFDSQNYSVSIPEDAQVGTTVISDIKATDNDKSFDGNSRLTYRITPNQTFSDYFLLEVPTKPTITLKQHLDYEKVTKMVILIEAMDSPTKNRGIPQTSTATLTVYITDADDQNPKFSQKTYRGVISEDASPGTIVDVTPPIIARDPDTMNVSVTYRLLDPYDFFDINTTTATIRNKRLFDVDVPTLTVVVMASQVDNPNREWFAMLTITISEANINAPSFTKNIYKVTRTELEPVKSILVSTTARDPDFKTITGTVLEYAITDPVEFFSIDQYSCLSWNFRDTFVPIEETAPTDHYEDFSKYIMNICKHLEVFKVRVNGLIISVFSGNIILEKSLDYEEIDEHIISVTASDGVHTAQATVEITVLDVNDNNPRLNVPGVTFNAERIKGYMITTVSADDDDIRNVLRFELRSNTNLFKINYNGEITVLAEPEQLTLDRYSILVSVLDDGTPPRESSKQIDVIFPPLGYTPTSKTTAAPTKTTEGVAAASVAPDDNMLAVILGAVAGVLLVVILILVVYIVWKNKRTKEELDRARAPRSHAAQGLTYRQAEVPDDLPKMDLSYADDTDGISDFGATTVQENPLRKTGVNQGYLQSSGSEMDRDISEIEVETAVVPYDDDFGYPSNHGQFRTFHGDDTTSNESNHSDSTGGSQRVLVNGNKKDGNKMTSWDSDDKIHPQGAEKLLDSKSSTASRTKKERPEITVYF
ncbi:cadherin EGF LAG seven-pass G-type receptor 2-like [Mercenaria mercenaria]|uniref:cadherin EGF LAG seven-pass G-type receptor 2-like n=1 Tax=Mercenaria mercenaria TaxID=6596 RepID=UPI00234E8597|nr:cadherin EGF LAG seven-pass G-type receptor 2-like [Mercenaria mercenaria]